MKPNQRITLTKRLLQETLLRLLETKPLDKITVTELCNESGINRTTFYRHYNVPRDVLMEMQLDFNNKLLVLFGRDKAINTSKRIEDFTAYLYDKSHLLKIFIKNCSTDDFVKLMNEMFKDVYAVKDMFPEFRDIDEENIKLISSFVAGGGYFMFRRWLMEDINKTPKEIADLIISLLNRSANTSN